MIAGFVAVLLVNAALLPLKRRVAFFVALGIAIASMFAGWSVLHDLDPFDDFQVALVAGGLIQVLAVAGWSLSLLVSERRWYWALPAIFCGLLLLTMYLGASSGVWSSFAGVPA